MTNADTFSTAPQRVRADMQIRPYQSAPTSFRKFVGYENITPSGCACHPSKGGELPGADTVQPPRQATPATPPQEGNTTPSGFAPLGTEAMRLQ